MAPESTTSESKGRAWAAWLPMLAGVVLALHSNAITSLNADLGWILDFGRRAVEEGKLPAENASSFIEPNTPVVMHEWLACIAFYLFHRSWGASGLLAMKALLMAATVIGLAAALRSITKSVTAVLLALLGAVSWLHISFTLLRPQLFAWFFLSIIVAAGLSSRRWLLWCCLPIVVLWANMHGSVLAGVTILALLSGGTLLEQRWSGAASSVSRRELVAIPVLSAIALLANPWWAGLQVHTWRHATDQVRLLNAEWRPLLRAGPWLPFERDSVIVFAAITGLALVLVPFRRVREWTLLMIAIVSSISAQRHLRMAPILVAPMATAILDKLFARVPARLSLERWSSWFAACFAAVLGSFWLGSVGEVFNLHDRSNMNIGNALWMMRANGIHGRIWNDFNWGGTILWALPESQVACDGRNVTAYSPETLRKNILLAEQPDPLAMVQTSGADLVLLPKNDPMLKLLRTKFVQIYCDELACLLSSNPAHLERVKFGLRQPPLPIPATAFFTLPGRPFLDLKPDPAGDQARE